MRHIGLTGGIGSGKSTVAKVLEHMGYGVFYSDQVAKSLYDENEGLKQALIDLLGEQIYVNGRFQKELLSQMLFAQPSVKDQIAQLVHPLVRQAFSDWAALQKSEMVFNEAAILIETGVYKQFSATVLVVAPLEIRIQRVQERDDLSREAVLQRIENQWPDSNKMSLTPYVIINDGQPLFRQIEDFISQLKTDLNYVEINTPF
jgi:dephospho-CoA kinase